MQLLNTLYVTIPESYLHLEGVPGDEMPTVDVVACVDAEVVRNESVVLLGVGKFLKEREAFASSRRGGLTLCGTDEFRLCIEPDGASGDIWISLQVARVLYTRSPRTGRLRSGRRQLEGGVAVPGESVTPLCRDLRRLLLREAA